MVNFAVTRHVLGQIVKIKCKRKCSSRAIGQNFGCHQSNSHNSGFLDIEGAEFDVLQTTDFEKITVGILLIEMNKVGGRVSKVMRERGFVPVGHRGH